MKSLPISRRVLGNNDLGKEPSSELPKEKKGTVKSMGQFYSKRKRQAIKIFSLSQQKTFRKGVYNPGHSTGRN